ncbi:MAG TPA: hypothetical protein VFV19_04755 [Candidatus Polarisedimenticolaceae bacterium]|nr:hypothetical protein [Candidatus Polarisedimenticolaceae bacterium]
MNGHLSEDRLLDLAAGLVERSLAEPLLAHVRSCGACESRFRDICGELERSNLAPPVGLRRARVRVAIGLAAAALIGIVLFPLLRVAKAPGPAEYWLPVENDTVALRAGRPLGDDAVFAEAAEAYARHDAARVIGLLRDRTIPETQDPLKLLYASAALHRGDAPGALATLEALEVDSLPQPYRDRAKWIELGALLALSRGDDARRLAAELAARPGEFSKEAERYVRP